MDKYRGLPVLAVDFETTSLNPFDPESRIVGVGLSDGVHADYFEYTDENAQEIMELLLGTSLIMHNATFDAAWIYAETGQMPTIRMCTLAAFKCLATEGWKEQKHSLKIAMTSVLGWEEPNNILLNAWLTEHGLTSADMWKAPADILGPYCAKDAGATYHLFDYFNEILEQYPALTDYLTNDMVNLIELVIEQQAKGFAVDAEGLYAYYEDLEQEVNDMEYAILQFPAVQECDKILRDAEYQKILVREPPKFTKANKLSKRWLSWKERLAEVERAPLFNIRSNTHKQMLFFDYLEFKPVKLTPARQPSTDKDSLPHFGEIGQALMKYNKKNKELGYVKAARSQIKDGVIHPRFKTPGTVTGRLAGDSGFNLQQQPKTVGYLRCLQARPGHRWIQMDFDAIEPKTQAMFSRDENMMKLYGPDAPLNDVYLFNGSHMEAAGIAEKIRQYYDPDNPTLESITLAKKECKSIRYICKCFTLAADYGAWTKKLYQVLLNAGITNITFEQVHTMYNDYWTLYAGKREFSERLKYEWQSRGGFIMNARGRPLAVDDDYVKDLLNRFAQSTGHDVLMAYLLILNRKRKESGLNFYPVIVDFHDETIWEAKEEDAEAVADLMKESMNELNELLSWDIKMTGDPEIVTNLAAVKCEDYEEAA